LHKAQVELSRVYRTLGTSSLLQRRPGRGKLRLALFLVHVAGVRTPCQPPTVPSSAVSGAASCPATRLATSAASRNWAHIAEAARIAIYLVSRGPWFGRSGDSIYVRSAHGPVLKSPTQLQLVFTLAARSFSHWTSQSCRSGCTQKRCV
jgi:hypothetical protein